MRRELLCGGVLLAIAAIFWTRRGDRDSLVATFPDFVLVFLALLGIGVVVRAFMRRGDEQPQAGGVDTRFLVAAIALMLLWALSMGLVGFTISSVLAFVVAAQLIRRGRPRPWIVAKDLGVAVVAVVGVFFVFTEVLLVPLPVSVLIGM